MSGAFMICPSIQGDASISPRVDIIIGVVELPHGRSRRFSSRISCDAGGVQVNLGPVGPGAESPGTVRVELREDSGAQVGEGSSERISGPVAPTSLSTSVIGKVEEQLGEDMRVPRLPRLGSVEPGERDLGGRHAQPGGGSLSVVRRGAVNSVSVPGHVVAHRDGFEPVPLARRRTELSRGSWTGSNAQVVVLLPLVHRH